MKARVALACLAPLLAACTGNGENTNGANPAKGPGPENGAAPQADRRDGSAPPPGTGDLTLDDLLEPPPPVRIELAGTPAPGAPASLRVVPRRPASLEIYLFRVGDLAAFLARAELGRGGVAHPERLIAPVEAALRRAPAALRPTLPRRSAPEGNGPDPGLEFVWRSRLDAVEGQPSLVEGPVLEGGVWLWVARSPSHDEFLPFAVGGGALWLHRAGDWLSLAAVDGDGRPAGEARVLVAGADGRVEETRTDGEGLATARPGPGEAWVALETGGGVVLARAPEGGPVPPALDVVAAPTDHEAQAGSRASVIVLVRRAGPDGGFRGAADEAVSASWLASDGYPFAAARGRTDGAGLAILEFEVPPEAPLGPATIRVEASLRVALAYATVLSSAPALALVLESVPPGGGWRLRALHSSGAPARDARVEAVVLDERGREIARLAEMHTSSDGLVEGPIAPPAAARIAVSVRSSDGSRGRAVIDAAAREGPELRLEVPHRLLRAGEEFEFVARSDAPPSRLVFDEPGIPERKVAPGEDLVDRVAIAAPGVHRLVLSSEVGTEEAEFLVADEAGSVPGLAPGPPEEAVRVEARGSTLRWLVRAEGAVVLFFDDPSAAESRRIVVPGSLMGESPLRAGGSLAVAGHDASGSPWVRRIALPDPEPEVAPDSPGSWLSTSGLPLEARFGPVRLEAATAWSTGTPLEPADAYDRDRHVENRTGLSDDLLFRAVLALQEGRPAEAAELAGRILEIDPFHPGAIEIRAKALPGGSPGATDQPEIPADPLERLAAARFDLDLSGRRLEYALRAIGRASGVEIVLDPAVLAEPSLWNATLDELRPARESADQVLTAIAARLGLVFRAEAGAVVVTTPARDRPGLLEAILALSAAAPPGPEAPGAMAAAESALEIEGASRTIRLLGPLSFPPAAPSGPELPGARDLHRLEAAPAGHVRESRSWIVGPERALLAPRAARELDQVLGLEISRSPSGPVSLESHPVEVPHATTRPTPLAWSGLLPDRESTATARISEEERARLMGARLLLWTSPADPLLDLLGESVSDSGLTAGALHQILAPVLVAASRRLGREAPEVFRRAAQVAGRNAGYPQIAPGGGFGAWAGAPADPRSTADVLEGLALAREAGLAVPPELIDSGREAARRFLATGVESESAWRLLALLAPEARDLDPEIARRLQATDFDSASDAVLLHARSATLRAGMAEPAAALAGRIEESATRGVGLAHWGLEGSASAELDSIELTARALLDLLERSADSELVRGGLAYLMARRAGPSWGTAHRDLAVLRAILAALEADPSIPVAGERAEEMLDPAALPAGPVEVRPGASFRPAWYTLVLEFAPPQGDPDSPEILRTWRPLEPAGENAWRALDPVDPGRLEAGRPYRVELRLARALPAGLYRVEESVPPGALVWGTDGPAALPARAGDLTLESWVEVQENSTEVFAYCVTSAARGRFRVPGARLLRDEHQFAGAPSTARVE